MTINDRMPEYCLQRAIRILSTDRKAINGAKVLVLGVAYKHDIDDYRESPAIRVIEQLIRAGASVTYYDPWVHSFRDGELSMASLPALKQETLEETDLVIITTAHTNVDYELVQRHAKAIFDTKNVLKHFTNRENIQIL